jgi:acyl-CoA reductase-like NAD-dependent aldehyde dehydrogenase
MQKHKLQFNTRSSITGSNQSSVFMKRITGRMMQAGVFTSDNRRIFEAFEALEVGGVVAKDVPTFRVDHMPYGGVKGSGTGREGARYATEEMTERKILVLNLE